MPFSSSETLKSQNKIIQEEAERIRKNYTSKKKVSKKISLTESQKAAFLSLQGLMHALDETGDHDIIIQGLNLYFQITAEKLEKHVMLRRAHIALSLWMSKYNEATIIDEAFESQGEELYTFFRESMIVSHTRRRINLQQWREEITREPLPYDVYVEKAYKNSKKIGGYSKNGFKSRMRMRRNQPRSPSPRRRTRKGRDNTYFRQRSRSNSPRRTNSPRARRH